LLLVIHHDFVDSRIFAFIGAHETFSFILLFWARTSGLKGEYF